MARCLNASYASDVYQGKTMKRYIMLALAIAAVPTAHADWQFTRWGMTPSEVVEAGKGTVTTVPEDQVSGRSFRTLRCTLEQTYKAGDMELRASMCFDSSGKLTKVSVEPTEKGGAQCGILETELTRKYGTNYATENDSVSHNLHWQDESRTTDILLYESLITRTCHINYDAVSNSMTKGL
jgi:hypothetical protein